MCIIASKIMAVCVWNVCCFCLWCMHSFLYRYCLL